MFPPGLGPLGAQPARGPSAREQLRIGWAYPTFEAPSATDAAERRTAARAKRQALPLEAAFAELAREDPRPLLVLRECLECSGTDDALLSKTQDNERTLLLSRWFHCVKLSPDVTEPDHPFHALFADPGTHLFLAHRDGSGRLDLRGDQSRTELWDKMGTLLAASYTAKFERPLKQLFKLLDEFDVIDERITTLRDRLDDAIESDGPDGRKAKKLRKQLEKAEKELAAARERVAKASELALKPPPPEEPRAP